MLSGADSQQVDWRQVGFYFYFPEKQLAAETLNCTATALIEGLRELDIPVFANVSHPLASEKALKDASKHFVVFEVTQRNYSADLMRGIAEFQSFGKIINSVADMTPGFVTPDSVGSIMAHENRFVAFKQRRYAWGFGLTEARLKRHSLGQPSLSRANRIIRNFRPSNAQGVRDMLDVALLPQLEKHFEIDRTVCVESYAERLGNSIGCLAYGGMFHTELTRNEAFQNNASLVELAKNRTLLKEAVVVRWDSYRFWESLAAGCLTFQLDFEEYGFSLPMMPIAWRHYVPIRLDDIRGSVEQLVDRRAEWSNIAGAGQAWALEHYSPRPVAERFLGVCAAELRATAAPPISPV